MKSSLALAALLLAGCATIDTNEQRIARLENRVGFVYEIVRKRNMSEEWCANYTDDDMRCKISDFGVCACEFRPDAMDIENARIQKAAEKLAKEKADGED
jgi:uncharacterized protein YceK